MYKINNISKKFFAQSWKNLFLVNKSKYSLALDGISLNIPKTGIVGIWGENGSGKSTLMKVISGLLKQDAGVVDETLVTNSSYISGNDRSFFWRLTVKQNIFFFGTLYGLKENEIKKKLHSLAVEFGIHDQLNSQFMVLSSGNKKKVSIIRSLLKHKSVLLFDEISTSLDQKTKLTLLDKISKIGSKSLIFWSTHDEAELKKISNHIIHLEDGKLLNFYGTHLE